MAQGGDCFTFLITSVPQWIKDIDNVEVQIKKRQDEIAQLPSPSLNLSAYAVTGESTNDRDSQVRDHRKDSGEARASEPAQDGVCRQPSRRKQGIFTLPRIKQKTASILSNANMSAPTRAKTRSMIIVYYDSEVQKGFEKVVQNIGCGRGMLRKGKMAARMSNMTRRTSGTDFKGMEGLDSSQLKAGSDFRAALGSYRRSTSRGSQASPHSQHDGAEAYDNVDDLLEEIQALLEKAAHQFLRDGDCHVETWDAKQRFNEVIELSQKEKERLEEARQKERDRKELNDAKKAQVDTSPAKEQTSSDAIRRTMEIEVDDEDDDDDEEFIPLPPIRTTRAMRGGV